MLASEDTPRDIMPTAYITHPACLEHDPGDWHPESPHRLRAIDDQLHAARLYDFLAHHAAPRVERGQLLRVHDAAYLDAVEAAAPASGRIHLDPDTVMSPGTLEAARRAAGGAVLGVDLVMRGTVRNAFVACRPPGHHATRNHSMGFCVYNNVAVAAAHALAAHGLGRVAIVDFDVHHGNGSEDIFRDEPCVLLCSSFQHPFYPYSGAGGGEHYVSLPLPAGTTGRAYRAAFSEQILPRLEAFQPRMILFSAGFDGHRDDDMAQFALDESDYTWITRQVLSVAARHAGDRVVSVLEGGYELGALGRSVAAHVRVLADL